MKKVLLVLVTVALLTSCGKSLRSAGGEVTGVRSVAFNEPAPYGMVLVKRGSFEMGPADKDSLWGIMPETKGVSFDAFWMDQTEVTNAKYRQFVYYVRDSIIRERWRTGLWRQRSVQDHGRPLRGACHSAFGLEPSDSLETGERG